MKQDFENLRHTSELIQIEEQCSKSYFKILWISQEAGASENNLGKEPQKPCPKLKNINIKNLQRIFALLAIKNASGRLLIFGHMY